MGLRIRIGLLICLAMGAVFTGMEAAVRRARGERGVLPAQQRRICGRVHGAEGEGAGHGDGD